MNFGFHNPNFLYWLVMLMMILLRKLQSQAIDLQQKLF